MPTCQECLNEVGGDESQLPCNSPFADGECGTPVSTSVELQILVASLGDKPVQKED